MSCKNLLFGLRSHVRMATMLGVLAACFAASAAEYFVSKDRPDNSGDGTSIATAKRTIQAAMDLAKKGDIVTVLPGVYDEGEGVVGSEKARVVVTNECIWLRSSGGKERTFIVGRHADTESGLGDGALQCVYLGNVAAIVEGFTICNGAGGVKSKSNTYYNYICDCVVSNNVAESGAGVANSTVLRCLVSDNTCTVNGSAIWQGRALGSIFLRNKGPQSLFQYCYNIIGCTIAENSTSTTWQGRDIVYQNCIVSDHTGVFAIPNENSYAYASNCVISCGSSEFKDSCESVFEETGHQFVAPIFEDYRILSSSEAVGRGDPAHITGIRIYSPDKQREAYLKEKYQYRDFYGNEIPGTGAIDCGAIQGCVTPEGGCVVFSKPSGCRWTSPTRTAPAGASYAYAESYPTQFCVKAGFDSGKSLFMYQFDPTYELYCFFPEMDGYFRFVPPQRGSSVSLNPVVATCELYADAENGDDANDGSSRAKAFKTLQAAVNAASAGYYDRTLIHAAPGYYDQGGNFAGALSNRIDNLNKTLYIRAEEGPERTFIVGAADPDTKGLGPNAVRCVKWSHSGRIGCLQGFTLTGGYTDDGDRYAESRIASAYYGSYEHIVDCIISNNHAVCAGAGMNGVFFRCRILENFAKVSWILSCPKMVTYCLIDDNTVLADADAPVTREGYYRFCTIGGAAFDSAGDNRVANYYGCIFERPGPDPANCVFEDCFAASNPAQTEIPGIAIADPCMVGGNDHRLLSISPAYGTVSLENPAWHYSCFSSDLSGCSPYWNGAAMTAGAYSRPLQAVSVTGPKDSLSLTGTNGVEFAETLVVAAQATRPGSTARFLGFTVNGEQLPADRLTYEVSGAGLDGIVEIVAGYQSIGLKMILR